MRGIAAQPGTLETDADQRNPNAVTLGALFTDAELASLSACHGVDKEVAELVSSMLRIIECRRLGIKP